MRVAMGVAGVIAAATLALAGCTSDGLHHDSAPATSTAPTTVPADAPGPTSRLATDPRTAGCWWAIHDQYDPGTAQLTGEETLPPACVSLNPDDIPDVRNDVLAYLNGG
jgi:hypothetical protein